MSTAAATAPPALELRDLHVVFTPRGRSPVHAVAGVNLTVERGQVVGLVGETGCGKSSLALAAVGLVDVASGSVLFDGRPAKPFRLKARDRRDRHVQLVFQNPFRSLNPRRRIGDQIADGLRGMARAESRRRVVELLEQVGIPGGAAAGFPHEYSGGQRQRIAIARALTASPSVLILDEPLSSLDASAQAQVANLLTRLARELHVAMLLISHDLAIVHQVADLVAVMYLGKIVEQGETLDVWRDPLHPYSEALIRAIPRIDGEGIVPESLEGEVPDPARPPGGCRFHPRCSFAFGRCENDEPRIERLSPRRSVACWLQFDAGRPTSLSRLARISAALDHRQDQV